MKELTQSRIFREVLIFAGLMGVMLVASSFISDPAFASLITGDDNPSAISGATGGESDARSLILTFVNFILGFLGLIAVLMVIYAGFLILTAAGNDEAYGKGKKILLYAIIGIVIILLSFALINTVLQVGLGDSASS